MSDRDTWLPQLTDIPMALGLLTRIPITVDTAKAQERGAAHAWAYPLVGVILGCISMLIGWLAWTMGLGAMATGFCIVALTAIVTGAMHEDGLADTLDGLWGGWTPNQRLDIMKDSHIGVYGVVGLVTAIGIKAALWGHLVQDNLWPIIGVMAISRAAMLPIMAYLPNARKTGLSAQVGAPSVETAWLGMAVGGVVAIVSGAWAAILLVPLITWGIAMVAREKINGQTGDILGATQYLAEIAALIAIVALS
ncbi:MAG: adenosylcobinamide-GDP ribazoletransferase [Planktomarina sp.]